ncbi:putative metalloprotease [Actinoplanes octamycinicus]|uniref:Putative metalloprotease n=1 Tax=Actinoplanes octamycinicus TaxID=135948 RepID=A0A7W7GZJ7_9ACTN|nr:neutral zinc metallopeptidase [Actinoplanes octamycinicus]MBB4741149.1 putative metalloprotease [Actinoplanes octamycinicus]GIE56056.1 hypothetical protein Aoc01nite_14580 [Actinoplanes octamycinicus]
MPATTRSLPIATAIVLACCSCAAPAPVLPRTTAPQPSGAGPAAAARAGFDRRVAGAMTRADRFWAGYFAARGLRYQPVRGHRGYDATHPVDCGSAPLRRTDAIYCPAEDVVAFDIPWLRELDATAGGDAVALVIAHEVGHAVQARLGLGGGPPVRRELQADCLAGASTAAVAGADRAFAGLAATADPADQWWMPDFHGTAAERVATFRAGFLGGVPACDPYQGGT